MHTSFSQTRWLNLAECVSSQCVSTHTPAASRVELRCPSAVCAPVVIFLFLHLQKRELSVFTNSFSSLFNNNLHYPERTKTPVSLKNPWGKAFFAANRTVLSGVVYWHAQRESLHVQSSPLNTLYRSENPLRTADSKKNAGVAVCNLLIFWGKFWCYSSNL